MGALRAECAATRLYSLSKSFTSTAVGLAIAEGKLSLDDEVLKFFPDDAPAEPEQQPQGDASQRSAADVHRAPGRAATTARPGLGPRPFWRSRSRTSPAPISSTTRRPPTCSRPSCRRRRARPCSIISVRASSSRWASRSPTWESQPPGNQSGRLWPEHPHRRHRQVRPALPAKGKVERQAARARLMGRGGHRAADLERQQPEERLGPGLRLPVLALPPRCLSRRWGVRAVLHRRCPIRMP